MRPLEFLEVGDWVLCDMIQRGRGRASGVPTEGRFWLAWQFVAGKAVRQYAYSDQASRRWPRSARRPDRPLGASKPTSLLLESQNGLVFE